MVERVRWKFILKGEFRTRIEKRKSGTKIWGVKEGTEGYIKGVINEDVRNTSRD